MLISEDCKLKGEEITESSNFEQPWFFLGLWVCAAVWLLTEERLLSLTGDFLFLFRGP